MSDRTATRSAPAQESSTTTTSILAIDLGKFKSVACRYDAGTGAHAFETIATTPPAVHDLLIDANPQLLVIEACGSCGWIADLAESLSIEVRVANVLGEAWKWKRVKRKTDRDDALKLAKLAASRASFSASSRSVFRLTRRHRHASPSTLATRTAMPSDSARSATQPADAARLDHQQLRVRVDQQVVHGRRRGRDRLERVRARARVVAAGDAPELAQVDGWPGSSCYNPTWRVSFASCRSLLSIEAPRAPCAGDLVKDRSCGGARLT